MRDPQDVKPVIYDSNGCEVYPGETVYHVEVLGKMRVFCPDCFELWARYDLTLGEIADAFGIREEVV